jgi:hypothetical protein
MRKRVIHVLNWEKYQARHDKELPWLKLWGALFKRPWFQLLPDDEKFVTIVFLDLARQFNNRIPDLSEFKGYLKGNYGVFMEEERVFKLCKVLSHNEFLSDNTDDLQDKIRQDKTSESDNNALKASFQKFWGVYPKKVAKEAALKAFKKISPDEPLLNKIVSSVQSFTQTKDWQKEDGQFIPNPASWLNGRRWEDEIAGNVGRDQPIPRFAISANSK